LLEFSNKSIQEDLLERTLSIDAVVNEDVMSVSTINILNKFKPYVIGNKKPIFAIKNAVVTDKKVLGTSANHLKLTIKSETTDYTEGIMFDSAEDIAKINIDDELDFAGYLDENEWNGNRSIQFQIKEWKHAGKI